ncbi:unnamed protein product [Ostreobium quekettii]|uniref:Lumazine-binding domain-containing protein n=1 Tax=Ostreobium quekettii TaxID=121088 RepID=A0A8S1J8Y4_9CHLO|nr:unnamed protein product [Ostreobium quekettii]|eukprot:evm.model.scf_564EXC.3 EVM.evm.TU.scf_564EXC.3   scf_564EXC:10328-12914(-)
MSLLPVEAPPHGPLARPAALPRGATPRHPPQARSSTPHATAERIIRPQLAPISPLLSRYCDASRRRRASGGDSARCLFTGIVQGRARVRAVDRREGLTSLVVELPEGGAAGLKVGASVAIDGTCLTATGVVGREVAFDVVGETLRRTGLGKLREGSLVNYERSARVGDEVGGHNTSGHIHTTAQIASIESTADNCRMLVQVGSEWLKYILPKGFIALDGVSLTVGEVLPDAFSVYLIPETLRVTTLGDKVVGDSLNVEIESQTQVIVDTVERTVARYFQEGGKGASKSGTFNGPGS